MSKKPLIDKEISKKSKMRFLLIGIVFFSALIFLSNKLNNHYWQKGMSNNYNSIPQINIPKQSTSSPEQKTQPNTTKNSNTPTEQHQDPPLPTFVPVQPLPNFTPTPPPPLHDYTPKIAPRQYCKPIWNSNQAECSTYPLPGYSPVY